MNEYSADPSCQLCSGSGIHPESKPLYHDGAPSIADPCGLDPCDCIVQQWPSEEITGYPDHYILNGDHSQCFCGGDLPNE